MLKKKKTYIHLKILSAPAVYRLFQVHIQRLATGWTVRGSNPGKGEIFSTRPDWPWGLPSLLYNEYQVIAGGKAAGAWR
jgi:hypothetical protein